MLMASPRKGIMWHAVSGLYVELTAPCTCAGEWQGVVAVLSSGKSNCHLDRVLILACLYYECLYQLRKHRKDRSVLADVFKVYIFRVFMFFLDSL
jgi:hypothetical protein